MNIQAVSAFNDNYIWMINNEKTRQTLCVDPGDAEPVLRYLKNEDLSLSAILLTHHHNDHIGGVAQLLKSNPGLAVYGPRDSRIPELNHALDGGDVLKLDSYEFQIISIPGHTATHIAYYEPHQGWLFCGDTLFSAGCGRVFDGTIEQLYDSLLKLKNLPDTTQVFCGHEYTVKNLQFAATVEPENQAIRTHAQRLLANETRCSLPSNIALEKEINPFFRSQDFADFKRIRAEKDQF